MNKQKAWDLPYGVVHLIRMHQESPDTKIHTKLLKYKKHFSSLPKAKNKPLYRGMELSSKDFQKLLRGETLKPIKKLESWTTDREVARGFGTYIFKKVVPVEQQVVDISVLNDVYDDHYDNFDNEREVICTGQSLTLEHLMLSDDDDITDYFGDLIRDKLNVSFIDGGMHSNKDARYHVLNCKRNGTTFTLKVQASRVLDWNLNKRAEMQFSVVVKQGKIEDIPELKKKVKEGLAAKKEPKKQTKSTKATINQDDVVSYLKKLPAAKRKALLKKVS